ncbi:hypothetical protein EV121DRAFT_291156 [Schizophyllum commune]
MTALAHPSLSPNPTTRSATSLKGSLAALGDALNQLPDDPVSITVRVANKEVELWLVDRVTICLICDKERLPKPIQGWQTLRLRMPDECLGTNVPFGVQYPTLSPTELRGKTIVYSGGPKNVPFPWFALEALTGWGVEVVYILRVITAAQLTHLIASAHYDIASLDIPLTLRVLGVERDIDQTPPAKPVLYHSNYRLRTVDLGVVGPGIEHVNSLIGAPIAKITALELDLTKQKNDSVLKDIEECENLMDLRSRIDKPSLEVHEGRHSPQCQ